MKNEPTEPGCVPPRCGCAFAWRSYGRLYGLDMGEGWQLAQRRPGCEVMDNHGRGPWPGGPKHPRLTSVPTTGETS